MSKIRITILLLNLLTIVFAVTQTFAQTSNLTQATDAVTTVLVGEGGVSRPVGSGVVVRSDGFILTAYHLIKNAAAIQIRLRSGEIYDKAEIVSTDERRDVALLHINAVNLRAIPSGAAEETQVGSRISIIANADGQALISQDKVLNSVQLADAITGAGKGFRVLQFDAADNAAGALVLDENGRSLGIVTNNPDVKNQSIAVPFSSILGLIRAASPVNYSAQILSSPAPTPQNTPYPIPQSSVQMPERGVTALSPRGPGSVVIKPNSPKEILAASRTIYVESDSVFFKGQHLVNALDKRPEFAEWGLSFVEDRDLADLILTIDHVVFTYKFTFKIYSQRLGTIIATGDTVILDGNLGAPYMAKRVIQKLEKVRAAPTKPEPTKPDKK